MNGQPEPRFADIPGVYDYANVIAAKFLGGEKIDLMYCHSDQLNRWYQAGWLRDDIEHRLEHAFEHRAEHAFRDAALDAAVENATVEIPEEIVAAIRAAARGETVLSAQLT